jgi:hypothetical protein
VLVFTNLALAMVTLTANLRTATGLPVLLNVYTTLPVIHLLQHTVFSNVGNKQFSLKSITKEKRKFLTQVIRFVDDVPPTKPMDLSIMDQITLIPSHMLDEAPVAVIRAHNQAGPCLKTQDVFVKTGIFQSNVNVS